ncbi:Fis family transcriptional regulator [Thalassotalea ganghwensis]
MRKTDKKIDNQLRRVLTDVCQQALESIEGFQWLTHQVNFTRFPSSLKIVCVFDTTQQLESFQASSDKAMLEAMVNAKLRQIEINLTVIGKHLIYDSEEACLKDHKGNWAKRLA